MDRRLMSLIFLFVTSSILGSVNGGEEDECIDDDDCWNRYVFGDGEYEEDTCCQGKCETHCPIEVFLWILVAIIIPIVFFVLCLGAIALIVFCVVGASTAAAKNSAGTSEAHVYPPNVSYAAYPPYTATNYGYQPPSYNPQPADPPAGKM